MVSQTKKYLFLIIGIILIIGAFLFWFFGNMYNWNETFQEEDKDPYGTSVLVEVIKKSVGQDAFHLVNTEPLDTLTKINLDTLSDNSNYIYVGEHMYLDEKETDFLLDFARKGNNLFLISKSFDQKLLDSLFLHPEILLPNLIELSYTPLDDRSQERIPCGYYDNDKVWHNSGYESPNGYIDEYGDWRELKAKDYDEIEYYLDETFRFEDDIENLEEEIEEEQDHYEDDYNEEDDEIIDLENYDDNGYWIEEGEVVESEEEEYDIEADTIGYYGQDGYWIRQDSISLANENNYYANSFFYGDDDGNYYLDYHEDSLAWMDFYNGELLDEALETVKIYYKVPINYAWYYFTENIIDDTIANPTLIGNFLGAYDQETYTNFVSIDFGKGKIFLHSTPLLFTNYMMIKEPYFSYAQEVFNEMGDGDVIWDESIRYEDEIEYNNNDLDNPKYHPDKGPLTFILSEPSLKWAWYTILISLVLYMFFGLRRNQRIIPVTIPNRNTSKEYAETIAQLYMSKGKHNDIYRLKMDLFMSFLRDRYGINAQADMKENREEIINSIIIKSEVNKQHVEDIFKTYNSTFFREYIMTKELVYFHDLLEEFYKNCK